MILCTRNHQLLRQRRTVWCFAVVLTLSALLCPPPTMADEAAPEVDLVPGYPGIKPSVIKPFSAVTDFGSMEVIRSDLAGRKIINVILTVKGQQGVMVDHIGLDANSMAMLFRFAPYFAVGQDYLAAVYDGSAIHGSLNPIMGGTPQILDDPIDGPFFDGAIFGFALATLPLEEGLKARLPRLAISASSREFSRSWSHIEVVDRRSVKGGDGKSYDCWIVEVEYPGTEFSETLAVANEPPYLIEKETDNGKNRRKTGFKSVSR